VLTLKHPNVLPPPGAGNEHFLSPVPHVPPAEQLPSMQMLFFGHGLVQLPQASPSFSRSTQPIVPPHAVVPGRHAHAEPVQN